MWFPLIQVNSINALPLRIDKWDKFKPETTGFNVKKRQQSCCTDSDLKRKQTEGFSHPSVCTATVRIYGFSTRLFPQSTEEFNSTDIPSPHHLVTVPSVSATSADNNLCCSCLLLYIYFKYESPTALQCNVSWQLIADVFSLRYDSAWDGQVAFTSVHSPRKYTMH